MKELIFPIISTFFASFFFGLSLSSPKRSLLVSAFLGFFGFLVYSLIKHSMGSEYGAVFFGALAASIPAEIFARTIKTPATVIIFVAVIPLVPGLKLYQSMLYFAQSNVAEGTYEIVQTIIYTGFMAIAITISTMLGKFVINPLFIRMRAKKTK